MKLDEIKMTLVEYEKQLTTTRHEKDDLQTKVDALEQENQRNIKGLNKMTVLQAEYERELNAVRNEKDALQHEN